ncbi:MAG: ABC transporter substrate-binding protein, partial [Firmicutes bacterium]|nr:ABC transporter substrate-binding protein [Bacillota bacterium]
MKKNWPLGLLAATVVAGLVTLGLALRSAAPWREGTLVYLLPSLPESLDPARAEDEAAGRVLPLLFEGLVRHPPGSPALEPALASSWETVDGGRTWVFHLRPGVVFHDGTPLTSEHVRASVARALEGAAPASYATFVYGAVQRVETPDPLTVRFTLSRPYAPFPQLLALPFAAPISKPGANGMPVGTGPFVVR